MSDVARTFVLLCVCAGPLDVAPTPYSRDPLKEQVDSGVI